MKFTRDEPKQDPGADRVWRQCRECGGWFSIKRTFAEQQRQSKWNNCCPSCLQYHI